MPQAETPAASKVTCRFGTPGWVRTSDLLRVKQPYETFFDGFRQFLIVSSPIRLFSERDLLHKIRLLHKLLWYKLWS